jgi:lipopolysaccharide export system permease protein
MKILSRYLFSNLLFPFLYLTVAFTLLFVIGDLMDNGSDFLENRTSIANIAYYYSLFLPSMVIMIVPICLLLAVLYSLSTLTRHSEITAMRASGISIYRIIRPYLLMGISCSLLVGIVNEYFGPKFAYKADQFLLTQTRSNDAFSHRIAYKHPTTKNDWYIEKFDSRTFGMYGVTLTQVRDDGSDKLRYKADRARWMDGRWWFEHITLQHYDALGNLDGKPQEIRLQEMRHLTEKPEDFLNDLKDPIYLSSLELKDYIASHRHSLSEKRLVSYQVDFHHRLTQPLFCLIIIFIGIPVGSHTGRRGAFAGIMMALLMFFGFYALQFLMVYLAKQLLIPIWLGPWGAIILFTGIGAVMIHRMR